MLLSASGALIFAFAKKQIGKEFSPCHEAYIPDKIVCEGVYSYVRHPIYSAMLLFFIGISLVSLHWLALMNLIALFSYYLKSVTLEEQALVENFQQYIDYQKKTGRFIPRTFSRYKAASDDQNKEESIAS